eukprot:gene7317-8517_t
MLIESAKTLPKWMRPATTHNRVFVRNGSLHIIPLASSPTELDILPYRMDIAGALRVVTATPLESESSGIKTLAPEKQYIGVANRMARFKSGKHFSKEQRHVAMASVPPQVAFVLLMYPQLISNVVRAFYKRDADDMHALATMERFPAKSERVDCKVRFTRCLFAQVKQQQFHQPRSFPPLPKPTSPGYASASLGVKLHCGIEILYAKTCQKRKREIYQGTEWKAYLNRLTKEGYFGGEKEGSRLYKEKVEKAKKEFKPIVAVVEDRGKGDGQSIVKLIDQLLEGKTVDDMMAMVAKANSMLQESSEKWMEKVPSRLEDMLAEFNKSSSGNQQQQDDDPSLQNISQSFMKMMEKQSSFQGVDFDQKSNDMSFNADKFMSILKNVVGMPMRGGDGEDGSDDDDEMYDDLDDYQDGNDQDDDDDEQDSDEEMDSIPTMDEDEYDNVYLSALKRDQSKMSTYMKQMDVELSSSSIAQSFERVKLEGDDDDDQQEAIKDNGAADRPIDLNFNLVKNILGSLSSQQGLAGPASSMLAEFIESSKRNK